MPLCGRCGYKNRAIARFCASCGTLLTQPEPEVGSRASEAVRFVPGLHIGANQRYQIKEQIGKGGFGEAYLAEDTHLRRLCLIKRLLINPNWDEATAQLVATNFAREARLLVELNHPGHPNIPEIYEYLPLLRCLVMKFITGSSLRRMLILRNGPLLEAEALRYARDVCAALVYMHSHSAGPVLHRDLKPDNVMVDAIGRVWLIDFGLAKSTIISLPENDSSQSQQGGTRGYAPPEQWRGLAEPRSDMYALGVMLYELLSGERAPGIDFRGSLRSRYPAIHPEVEQLVQWAMSPLVTDRPTAAELLARIEALLAALDIPPPPIPARPPSTNGVVGRETELDYVLNRLRSHGSVTLVGMPGAGKTTLAALVAQRWPNQQRVFWHTFRADAGVEPLIWQLAGWLAHHGYPAVWQQIQRTRQSGASLPPIDVLVSYLLESAGMRGSLICLNDVHVIANDASVERVVLQLRRAGREQTVALVLTGRTRPTWIPDSDTFIVPSLSLSDTHALLASTEIRLSTDLVEQLYQRTGGSPQFLTLAINVLQNTAHPEALIAQMLTDGQLADYLLREVDEGLSDEERRVMEALAVLGSDGGTQEAIESLLDGIGTRRPLVRLSGKHLVVVELRNDGAIYNLHATVQSFYNALLGVRERRLLHQRAGTHYEHDARDLLRAARHYMQAGAEPQAVVLLTAAPWEVINQGLARAAYELLSQLANIAELSRFRIAVWTVQGELALLLGNYEMAQQLLEQALREQNEVGNEDAVRKARCHRLLAEVYDHSGDYERAEASCRSGLTLAAGPGQVRTETARLYTKLAEVLLRCGRMEEAVEVCYAGLDALPPEPAVPGERAALLQRLATLEGERGSYTEAIESLEQSLGLARQSGDQMLIAWVLHNLGVYHYHSGRAEQSLELLNQSLQMSDQIGNAGGSVLTMNFLGLVYLALGKTHEAMQQFQESRQLSERLQLHDALALALLNIGQLHYEHGEFAHARTSFEQSHALFGRLGQPLDQAHCLYMLGDIALQSNAPAEALTNGTQALELARQVQSRSYESCALRVLGEAGLAQGNLQASAQALAEAWRLQESIGDPYDQALLLAARARLAWAQHESEQALELAQAALALAEEQHITFLQQSLQALLATYKLGK